MAKLHREPADLLYEGGWLTIRAIRRPNGIAPAAEWYASLDKPGQGRLLAAAQILETSLRSGRPPGQRAGAVVNSRQAVWELRVTPKGSTPPHLRLMYVREGQILWAATAFTKTSNKLKQSDIDAADRIVAEWRQGATP